jgi:hypothetical protein
MMLRKLIAFILTLSLAFPLLLASQLTVSTVSWALDRQFYIDALDNEDVYQAFLSEETLESIMRQYFVLPADVDVQPMVDVLDDVVTEDYLGEQVGELVNGFFDYLQGSTDDFDPMLDLSPVKEALGDEKQEEFLMALLAVLPVCGPEQVPSFDAEAGLSICKPQGVPEAMLIEGVLKPALPILLAQLPDEIPVGEAFQQWQAQLPWMRFLPGMAVPASIILTVLFLAFVAVSFWYIGGLIADDGWRGRLQWLGWSLMIPSMIVFAFGFLLQVDTWQYWLRYGLERAAVRGMPPVLSTTPIIGALVQSMLPRITISFLAVGGVCASLALGLILWGMLTPRKAG